MNFLRGLFALAIAFVVVVAIAKLAEVYGR